MINKGEIMRTALFVICFFLYLITSFLLEYFNLPNLPAKPFTYIGFFILGVVLHTLLKDWDKKRE